MCLRKALVELLRPAGRLRELVETGAPKTDEKTLLDGTLAGKVVAWSGKTNLSVKLLERTGVKDVGGEWGRGLR